MRSIRERVVAGTYRVVTEDVVTAIMAGPFPVLFQDGGLTGGGAVGVAETAEGQDHRQRDHG